MKMFITLIGIVMSLYFNTATATQKGIPEGIIVMDGRPAPPLKLATMDGASFDLNNSKGHWVFVHFWASWCGPCRREMPTIQALSETMKDTSLEIVLINTAETDDTVFNFLGIVAPDLSPLMDYNGQVTERWQPRGLPSTFLVDPSGRIQYLVLGGRNWNKTDYIEFIRSLVTSAKK